MARYYALAERPWIADELGGYWGLPPGTIGSVDLAPVGGTSYLFATSDQPFDAADVSVAIGDGSRLEDYSPSAAERSALVDRLGVSYQSGWKLIDWLWDVLTVDADPDGVLRCKPIMPTHRGVLELHLGGHSLIRSRRLPRDPTTDPAWPVIQRVLQNDYRAIRDTARRDPRQGDREATLHRKWLGAMQSKYRLSPEAARDLIGDSRDGLPLRPTTTVSDDFNRADSDSLGANWTEAVGNWQIVSNQLSRDADANTAQARYESDLSSDDHYAELEITSLAATGGGTSNIGPSARHSSVASTYYVLRVINTSSTTLARLFKSESGSVSQVGSDISYTPSLPDTVRLQSDGSVITGYINGSEVISATDGSISGNTRIGADSFVNAANTDGDVKADDFEASDLVAGPTLPIFIHHYRQLAGA